MKSDEIAASKASERIIPTAHPSHTTSESTMAASWSESTRPTTQSSI